MTQKKIRVLLAKPDLDGHDRGAKVVALALRDAGMEITYTGLHNSIDQIVNAAIQEDVDVIGLSIMTGAHLSIAKTLLHRLKRENIEDMCVIIGGVIPKQDIPKLEALGVDGVFPGGAQFDEITTSIKKMIAERGK
ncbi:cobalamin B12-binding domain-containing protein [Desulfococcaceae bacterium HSG7]|nr:cobalamin B12-binding domain-containing protein [Desulfococcaceae bacterium HSG7]